MTTEYLTGIAALAALSLLSLATEATHAPVSRAPARVVKSTSVPVATAGDKVLDLVGRDRDESPAVALPKVVESTVAAPEATPFADVPFAPLDEAIKARHIAMFQPLDDKPESKAPGCDCACEVTGICTCGRKVRDKAPAKADPPTDNAMPVPAGLIAPKVEARRILYFGYEACPYCRTMKATVLPLFSAPGVSLDVYDTVADPNAAGWAEYYGLNGAPGFVLLDANNVVISKHVGYLDLNAFKQWAAGR